MKEVKCYFDGCCEPKNPGGIASYGAVVYVDGVRIWECSKIFHPIPGRENETSNNVAEYLGFIAILEYLSLENHRICEPSSITIFGDSNLVIQQMFGTWRIKKGFYVPLAIKAKKLLETFSRIEGRWIPREQNFIADELSKRELVNAGVRFRIQPEAMEGE